MAMLHTVNKSPFEKNALASCLDHALDGAALLLTEDGVYGALAGTRFEPLLREAQARLRVYALEPDLRARGLDVTRVIEGIEVVGYDGFVDLAVEHDKVQAWL